MNNNNNARRRRRKLRRKDFGYETTAGGADIWRRVGEEGIVSIASWPSEDSTRVAMDPLTASFNSLKELSSNEILSYKIRQASNAIGVK